jgi:hypothetical protein
MTDSADRATLLQALSILAGCGVAAVTRERPKRAWPPMPKGTYRQAWLLTFADGHSVWVDSSDTFRDPKRCQAFLVAHGRPEPPTHPAVTHKQCKQLLMLMHAIAGDTKPPAQPHSQTNR